MVQMSKDHASDTNIELEGYEKISIELKRYEDIADYYSRNPSRIAPNKCGLESIKNRLVEISFSDEKIPKELQKKSDKILEFFVKSLKFYRID